MMAEGSLEQRFADGMGQLLGPGFPEDIALAVSGGGDSMAMLYLAHNWTRAYGLRLWVVTVDHGLRPEAPAEAAMVAEECVTLGWPHATLRWHWDGQGNVQDAARRARLSLINRWRGSIQHVLMAHTRDDLAETFLMRLARGSGVEGLSAMAAKRTVAPHPTRLPLPTDDVTASHAPPDQSRTVADVPPLPGAMQLIRPCLDLRRDELRHYLRSLKGRWVEDPSNDDPTYERVRMRRLLALLEPGGLGADTLAATARRMARAREALRARAHSVWQDLGQEGRTATTPTGEILLDRDGFAATEPDTQMRLLAAALQYVSSTPYRPRAEATESLLDRLLSGGAGTLQGCTARSDGSSISICREPAAVMSLTATVGDGTLWDHRWRMFHRDCKGLAIRALGEDGWAQCRDRPEGAPPFRSARSLPSIWDGGRLVVCDAMGIGPGHTTQLRPMGQAQGSFANFLLSH